MRHVYNLIIQKVTFNILGANGYVFETMQELSHNINSINGTLELDQAHNKF